MESQRKETYIGSRLQRKDTGAKRDRAEYPYIKFVPTRRNK